MPRGGWGGGMRGPGRLPPLGPRGPVRWRARTGPRGCPCGCFSPLVLLALVVAGAGLRRALRG